MELNTSFDADVFIVETVVVSIIFPYSKKYILRNDKHETDSNVS